MSLCWNPGLAGGDAEAGAPRAISLRCPAISANLMKLDADAGSFMPFRNLVAETIDLTKLAEAFDAAWIEINLFVPIAPQARSAAQHRLGEIIIALWTVDPDAPIVERAVAEFNARRLDSTVGNVHGSGGVFGT